MKTTRINNKVYKEVTETFIFNNHLYTRKVLRFAPEYDFSDRNKAPLNPCEKAPSFKIR